MEVTYRGTMRCPHCGHKNVNPIVLATNDDDTTLQCFCCGKDFEPSDEFRWREIPEAVLERCVTELAQNWSRHLNVEQISGIVLTAAHYAEMVEALKLWHTDSHAIHQVCRHLCDQDKCYEGCSIMAARKQTHAALKQAGVKV